ncbi:hypothetical protein DITRI_Ditri06bG0146300 [Diplodiscus trichospermus]
MRAIKISLFAFLLVTAAICISFCEGNSNVLCIESERQALLKFKQDLIDPSNRLSSWIDGEDCCDWVGVFCNNLTGHVNELHLGLFSSKPYVSSLLNFVPDYAPDPVRDAYEKSALRGKINPSLLDLTHLNYLDLSYNNFGGVQIPEFICSLKSLTYLNLFRANFSGAIPHKLRNLSKLNYLDLGNNYRLEAKALQWVSGLSSLQYLDLSGADLTNATDWLQITSKLPSLLELHLSGCELTNDPSPVSVNYTSLAVLDLSLNKLSSVATWIFSLGSLVSINLRANIVKGEIPNGFQNLSSLTFLDLSWNSFSPSSIPSWLSNLNQLQFLGLGRVGLQGNFSSVITNMSSLTHLDLSGNNHAKIVPKCLESLCNIREMDLSDNEIDHEVSEIIGSLSKCSLNRLETLNLASNKLFGHLTDQLGQFKNLAYLQLSKNSISGPIPFSVGKLSLLKILDVSNNKLNATVPQSLGQLVNLEYLGISNNMLEGYISEMHFSNLTRLRVLRASNNMLMFKPNPRWIPPFHCEDIYLGNWHLGPQFPQWLRFQNNLSNLDISHAGISGVIPDWFWNLSIEYNDLNFSNNQLIGKLPYLPIYHLVDLSSNKFTGSLPRVISADYYFLSNNLFSGSLSNFFCNSSNRLGSLIIFDVQSNLLSGEIPDRWENWDGWKL